MIYLEKKSIVELPKAQGAVSDTLSVEDKITNAPSINLVQKMAGLPQDGVIAFDGDINSIPEGYELAEDFGYNMIPSKVKTLYEADLATITPNTDYQILDLTDSLDNYNALLIQCYFPANSTGAGYNISSAFAFYKPNVIHNIEKTMSSWASTTALHVQNLQVQLYDTANCTNSQVQIQHSHVMELSIANGISSQNGKMAVHKIIGYKFDNIKDEPTVTPPSVIEFSISELNYEAENGMTWEQWISSSYNLDGDKYMSKSGYIYRQTGDGYYVCSQDSLDYKIPITEKIVADHYYYLVCWDSGGPS